MRADEKSPGVMRLRLRVRGIVQGVGFRPAVYALATAVELGGFVLNDAEGVVIEVEGSPEQIAAFTDALEAHPPPLAVVEAIETSEVPSAGETRFEIRESEAGAVLRSPISPDVGTCDDCLKEILDPSDRRFGYPFTNCTNCGPRFTITFGIPYDRPNTTMAAFPMCARCRAEYEDPTDRRFHAQPVACPECGPALALLDGHGAPIAGDALAGAADMLRAGRIVAVKGLGGYHLACDARLEIAVAELRRRKGREEKPLAVMVEDVAAANEIVRLDPEAQRVLESHRRPIVLLPRVPGSAVAESVAPGNRFLGVMLPYTPLHHLLLRTTGAPLVLTSGNLSDEPIAYLDADARAALGEIADAFLTHDRAIGMRCDDSVVRIVDAREYPIRRSRGYAPEPVLIDPALSRPVLAAGAELKNTFCVAKDNRAFVSHHIGDLETWEAMKAFLDGIEHFKRIFDVAPEVVAHDLHPDYLSTKWAQALEGVENVGVQHHHAHVVSCLADNYRSDRVIGLALDGTGYGDDGTLWGCEVLACDPLSYTRHIHLSPVPLPGGAAAVREPWRMAAVYLEAAFGSAAVPDLDVVRDGGDAWEAVLHMARRGINAPLTSGAGRLFDAAAAVCGVRSQVSYEGQAAAEFEQLADPGFDGAYSCRLEGDEIVGSDLIAAVAEDVVRGRSLPEVASGFHNGLATVLVEACEVVRAREGLDTVALSGGTWQNLLLLARVRRALESRKFEVLVHHRVPANDGGISLGQVVVAGAQQAGR